jgi:hypothetical protein
VHIHRDLNQARFDHFREHGKLLDGSNLEYLLSEVVSELIYHQVSEERADRVYQSRLELTGLILVLLQTLLKHPATLLVIAIEINLPQDVLVLLAQSS